MVYVSFTYSPAAFLNVKIGDGTGQFTNAPVIPLALPDVYGMQMGDLNNDGMLDLILVSGNAMTVQPYIGNGQGGFAEIGAAVAVAPARNAGEDLAARLADLNNDGILDLVLINISSGNAERSLGTGTCTFGPLVALPWLADVSLGTYPEVADVDGDGDFDVLVQATAPGGTAPNFDNVLVWRNNGSGTFLPPLVVSSAGEVLALGDLNNDGTLDLVSCSALTVRLNVRLNAPSVAAPTLTSFAPLSAAAGTVVTLMGSGFTGASAVTVNGLAINSFSIVNATTITFVLPIGSSGGPLTVTTLGGTATSAGSLTVQPVPYVISLAPSWHAESVPRTSSFAYTFNSPVSGASNLQLQSRFWDGIRQGTSSGDGSATLHFTPTRAFAPGERISVSVPPTIHSTGSGALAIAGSNYTYRAASGPATGNFVVQPTGLNGSHGIDGLVLADFNNDGKLDFVYNFPSITVALGDGLGGVAQQFFNPLNMPGDYLNVGDFNEDGNLDLVVAANTSQTASQVVVGFGDGHGHFPTSVTTCQVSGNVVSTAVPTEVRVGDINSDGHQDLIFILGGANVSGPQSIEVQFGDGHGGLTTQPLIPIINSINELLNLEVGDLNNDGQLDAIITNTSARGSTVRTYLGDGKGGFHFVNSLLVFATPYSQNVSGRPKLADLDADGYLDIILYSYSYRTIQVHHGMGNGTFGSAITLPLPTGEQAYGNPEVVDIDGDGDLDVVAAFIAGSQANLYSLYWLNNGSGSFGTPTAIALFGANIIAGDLNNDGTMDLVGSNIVLNQALATAPTISNFSPVVAAGGMVVTITGSNFTGATTVLVGGVPITGFTIVNATTITFTLPASSPTGLVSVITATGTGTSLTALRNGLATKSYTPAWPVLVYPNPAHNVATLVGPALADVDQVEITIHNLLGQLVRRFPPSSLSTAGMHTSLNLDGLTTGVYMLHLKAGNTIQTLKLAVE